MARKKPAASASQIEVLSPLNILLDPENPRLSPDEQGGTQPQLLAILLKRFKLVELGRSIASSGFIPFDPLVGLQDGKKVTVLEGNRRVAALQLLLDPKLAPEKEQATWRDLAESVGTKKNSLEKVAIHTYSNRDDVDLSAYIGFRHVTSVLKWPALEKAAYIARLIENQGWSYQKIAERIGSYSKHIERHYVAYRLVRQAEDSEVAGYESIQNSFGVLLRALQAGGVSEFLGVIYPGDPQQSKKPVSPVKMEEFENFVRWTFGTDVDEPVLHDSRQLTKWAKILQSPAAYRYLKNTRVPSFEAHGKSPEVRRKQLLTRSMPPAIVWRKLYRSSNNIKISRKL